MVVRWTEPAADDFIHICDYTEAHLGPAQGRRTPLVIYDSVDSLKTLIHKGRIGRKPGTRELSIPNCRLW